MFFERQHIALILDLSYDVVKNWSIGRPYRIMASIRQPGAKGGLNLYDIHDVYRFALAKHLTQRWGFPAESVQRILKAVDDAGHDCLAPEKRRTIAIDEMAGKRPIVRVVTKDNAAEYEESVERHPQLSGSLNIWVPQILDPVDKQIGRLQKEGKL